MEAGSVRRSTVHFMVLLTLLTGPNSARASSSDADFLRSDFMAWTESYGQTVYKDWIGQEIWNDWVSSSACQGGAANMNSGGFWSDVGSWAGCIGSSVLAGIATALLAVLGAIIGAVIAAVEFVIEVGLGTICWLLDRVGAEPGMCTMDESSRTSGASSETCVDLAGNLVSEDAAECCDFSVSPARFLYLKRECGGSFPAKELPDFPLVFGGLHFSISADMKEAERNVSVSEDAHAVSPDGDLLNATQGARGASALAIDEKEKKGGPRKTELEEGASRSSAGRVSQRGGPNAGSGLFGLGLFTDIFSSSPSPTPSVLSSETPSALASSGGYSVGSAAASGAVGSGRWDTSQIQGAIDPGVTEFSGAELSGEGADSNVEDPEDYFTHRAGIASLFKRVSLRYRAIEVRVTPE